MARNVGADAKPPWTCVFTRSETYNLLKTYFGRPLHAAVALRTPRLGNVIIYLIYLIYLGDTCPSQYQSGSVNIVLSS